MSNRIGFGQRAYHFRRLTGASWPALADRLDYRPSAPARTRRHGILMLAKEYAERAGFTWPIQPKREETQ
ncbi:MAG: hypothetical protein OXH64_03365 [Rhodospirillaceae bacterium]|nr:hypothetical protein [Rhodospirillaceae bacterium]